MKKGVSLPERFTRLKTCNLGDFWVAWSHWKSLLWESNRRVGTLIYSFFETVPCEIVPCQQDGVTVSKNCKTSVLMLLSPRRTVTQQLATVAVCLCSLNALLSKTVRDRLGLIVCMCMCVFVLLFWAVGLG